LRRACDKFQFIESFTTEAVFLIIFLVVSVVVLARMRDSVGESKKSGCFFQSSQISSLFYRPAVKLKTLNIFSNVLVTLPFKCDMIKVSYFASVLVK
jgi:hypothetical protein